MKKLVDLQLNVKPAAWAVLHMLTDVELKPHRFTETWAWYNGRERAVALTITLIGAERQMLGAAREVIVVGECRGSDHIFVDTWTDAGLGEPPSLENFTDEVYEARKTFKSLQAAADHVRKLVAKHCEDT